MQIGAQSPHQTYSIRISEGLDKHSRSSFCPLTSERHCSLYQGSPTSGPWTNTCCQISGSIRLEIKCTINVMCLNHPQTISLLSVSGRIVFHEISPWYQKCWGLWVCTCPLVHSFVLFSFPCWTARSWGQELSQGQEWSLAICFPSPHHRTWPGAHAQSVLNEPFLDMACFPYPPPSSACRK